MTDYDCEYCSYSSNKNGRCTRLEYSCPFTFLQNKVDSDIEKLTAIQEKLKECLEIFNSIENKEDFDSLNRIITNGLETLEFDFLNKDLVDEWENIIRPIENKEDVIEYLRNIEENTLINISELSKISRDYSQILSSLKDIGALKLKHGALINEEVKVFDSIMEVLDVATKLNLSPSDVGAVYELVDKSKLS